METFKRFLEESCKEKFFVYKMLNHSKKAIYWGIAINPNDRLEQHLNNKVKSTKYWTENDKIEKKIIAKNLPQKKASKMAHSFENQTDAEYPDYKIIATAGL
ncbi:MAG TPA: GIY-YIG nuclease family protein [bacterium]|nr:GIY-YIG nuclease family protein [bacterium]